MARKTDNTVENNETTVTRNVKKIAPNAEAIVTSWEDQLGLHRTVVISAAVLAFASLEPEVQANYITQAIANLRS